MMFLAQADKFVRGEAVENAHPAIQVFGMCAAMQWAHLPVAGGIYDQDPDLMDKFRILWSKQGKYEKAEQARRKAESTRGSRPGRRGLKR